MLDLGLACASNSDASLSDSAFFFDLVYALQPRAVDWDLVGDCQTVGSKLENARLLLSCARKLGAIIYLLPEDLVDSDNRAAVTQMRLSFLASLCVLDLRTRGGVI